MNELFESLRERMEEQAGREEAFVAFSDWTGRDLEALPSLGSRRRFAAGEAVIREGSQDDRDLFIVVRGELEAFRGTGQEEKRLIRLGPGDLFGEIAFVDGRPRSAGVRALGDADLLQVSPEDLDAFCEAQPRVALKFMREVARVLSSRIRRAGV